jgi:hypothetical protein
MEIVTMKAIRDLMDVVYGSGVECRVFSATHDDWQLTMYWNLKLRLQV